MGFICSLWEIFMGRYVAIAVFALLVVTGFISFRTEKTKYENIIKDLRQYQNNYMVFVESILKNSFDQKQYEYCLENCNRIQKLVKNIGIVNFRDPLRNMEIKDYLIIVNSLSDIMQMKHIGLNNSFAVSRINDLSRCCSEVIIRSAGTYEDNIKELKTLYKNPIRCFCNGIKCILHNFFMLFVWCGILNEDILSKIEEHKVTKCISGIVSMISFIANVVSILVGWDKLNTILDKFNSV